MSTSLVCDLSGSKKLDTTQAAKYDFGTVRSPAMKWTILVTDLIHQNPLTQA
jgi:hypothetical protein